MTISRTAPAALLAAILFAGPALSPAVADPVSPGMVEADPAAMLEAVMDAAQIGSLMNVVATEGARHGMTLERSLFAGQGGEAWAREVSAIQAPERLLPFVGASLREELTVTELSEVEDFLAGELGRRLVAREVETRRDMLDGRIEEAARAASISARDTDRAALIDEIIERLDLVDANVSGGLNANYAFYRGLGDGGAIAERMTERDMLRNVWAQEGQVREATSSWLRGYLTRAYAPFTEDELGLYIDFAESRAGRRYLAAVLSGFGRVFEATSYDLGIAAARFITQDAT